METHFIKILCKPKVQTFFLSTLIALNGKCVPRFMNLVTLIYRYSRLGYWKLSFQEIQINLNGLLGKLEIAYPTRNTLNRISCAMPRNYSEKLGRL